MTTTSQLTEYLRAPAQQQALLRARVYFGGVYASDQLPQQDELWQDCVERGRKEARIIVNYSEIDSPEGGTHWCVMSILKTATGEKRSQWFDSYATPPDGDDGILAKLEHHPFHTHFKSWLAAWGPIDYNKTRLQSSGSDVCGLYSAYFVLHGLPQNAGPWGKILRHTSLSERDREVARQVKV